jgi:aminomethyltransferase
MNKTPFNDLHRRSGARLIDFGGWEMPVQFEGILAEHRAVREKCGLFDIAHMGQVWVSGAGAFDFLQGVTTNDVSKLVPGLGQYSLLCREDGCIVDDLYVYKLDDDRYFLVVNAGRRGVDLMWLKDHAKGDVEIMERMDGAAVALQGPAAESIAKVFFPRAADLKKNEIAEIPFEGSEVLVARTGYSGEDGFEIFGDAALMTAFYPRLVDAGKPQGLTLCGLGARDTLRLEMGYRLYGNDLDEQHTALEAGLGWVVKFDKGDFVGRDHLAREKAKGSARRIVAFKLKERGIPRHGHKALFNGSPCGEVTSGTFSPSLQVGLGMAYVDNLVFPKDAAGTLSIDIHGRAVPADIVSLPFYKRAAVAA